jgi:hypothetical protein
MSNYWLSEFNNKNLLNELKDEYDDDKDQDDDQDKPEGDDDQDKPEGYDVKGNLSARQQKLYEYYEEVVEEFGVFNQTSKANGAHYAPAIANPFKAKGLICSNCVYFIGGGACEIVSGRIEPDAICKLWIIPEDLIKE